MSGRDTQFRGTTQVYPRLYRPGSTASGATRIGNKPTPSSFFFFFRLIYLRFFPGDFVFEFFAVFCGLCALEFSRTDNDSQSPHRVCLSVVFVVSVVQHVLMMIHGESWRCVVMNVRVDV